MLIDKNYKTLALLIVPFMLAVVDFFFLKAAFPLHSGSPGYDQDPAYAYLFNGLLILEGYPPYHIDHPGTPLQLLFALTIFTRWGLTRVFGGSGSDIVDAVINNPESYLHDMAVLLLALNLVALVFFGRRIAEATGKIYLGMFCQLSLLSFTIMAPKATYPAPEALLIFCSLLLLGLSSPRIFALADSSKINAKVSGKLIGATFALGLAIKITFVPMIFLFALVEKGRERRIGIITFVCVFALLTAPALPNIDRFLAWVTALASNSGAHGGGDIGFINLANIPTNLNSLFVWFPLFLIAIALAVLGMATAAIKNLTIPIQGSLVLVVVALLQSGLVLKHPGAHYMVSVLPIALVLLAWLISFFYPKTNPSKFIVATLIISMVFHSAMVTAIGIKKIHHQRAEMSAALLEIHRELGLFQDPLVICSFRCALPQYALTMALIYAPQLISNETSRVLNNFYDYDIFQSTLISTGKPAKSLDELIALTDVQQPILLVTPRIYRGLDSLTLLPLVRTDAQSLYRVVTDTKGKSR